MSRRRVKMLSVVLAFVIVCGSVSAPAVAGPPCALFRKPAAVPHFYPEHVSWAPYGYGLAVPTYNWGYFGARHRPTRVRHTGYHRDYVQWKSIRGY